MTEALDEQRVRIVTNTGQGDAITGIGTLTADISRAREAGMGVIEITTSVMPRDSREANQPVVLCPAQDGCLVSASLTDGKLKIANNSSPIPDECLKCADRKIKLMTGFDPLGES